MRNKKILSKAVMKMKWINKLLIMIMAVLLVVPLENANSQTSVSLSQNLSYFSNSFYNSRQLPDLNNNIGLTLSHIFAGEKIQSQLYYQGGLNLFQKYSDRFYHDHNLGYDGYAVNSDETKILYFGGSLFWHDGQQDYNIYDNWKLHGYLNSKIYLRENFICHFGYYLNNKNYSELPEFSYWEHLLFAQFNTYFQTRTSLTLAVNYGIKDYIPRMTPQGKGRGRQVIINYFEMPGVDQLVSNFKLAQSLGVKTSISIDYLNRLNPGLAGGSAAVIDNENLFTEDELFDDRYGYQGHELSVLLTHYFPGYVKFQLGGSRLWKNYQNRNIYDFEGNLALTGENRVDNRLIGWFELSRTFAVNWGIKNIGVVLQAGYLKNQSNDNYYQFDNYFGTIGLEFKMK